MILSSVKLRIRLVLEFRSKSRSTVVLESRLILILDSPYTNPLKGIYNCFLDLDLNLKCGMGVIGNARN